MKEKLGVGVVGAGSIGIRFALDHLSMPHDRVRLAAVCDPVEGRADAAAAKYAVPGAYRGLDDLLADPAVDLVTLCSPIGLHYEQGRAAIEAGKHVHFNKTMTVTSAEALDLIDRADANGVKLVASPGQMIRREAVAIREAVRGGAIGTLAWAVAGAAFGAYHEGESVREGNDVLTNVNPSWYWRKPGGGPMYDMTVYALHALTGTLGPAKRVTAMSGVRIPQREFRGEAYVVDADDNTVALLDFGDNVFAFVHGTVAGMVSHFGRPSFFGTGGSITGASLNGEPIPLTEYGEGWLDPWGPHLVDGHESMDEKHVYEDFMQLVDLVHDGTPTVATPQHAAHVIEIVEAAYRAAETGTAQDLTTTF